MRHRRLLRPLGLTLAFVLFAAVLSAEEPTRTWQRIGPPGGPVCAPQAPFGSTRPLLLIAAPRMFSSRDDASSWQLIGAGLPPLPTWITSDACALTFAPHDADRAYLVTYDALGYQVAHRSTDGGASWEPPGARIQGNAWKLVAVGDPPVLLAASRTSILRSTDEGATWRAARSFGPGASVLDLAVDPHRPDRVLAQVDRKGVFLSTDAGQRWRPTAGLPTVDGPLKLAFDPRRRDRVFLTGAQGIGARLYRSTNGGASWAPSDRGIPVARVVSVAAGPADEPDVVYALGLGNQRLLLRSTDGGVSWARAGGVEPPAGRLKTIGDTLYAHGFQGLFATRDRGRSWTLAMDGIRNGWAEALLPDPTGPALVALSEPQGLTRSLDGGAHWTTLAPPGDVLDGGALALAPQRPRRLFVGFTVRGDDPALPLIGGVATSLDRGNTFAPTTPFAACRRPFDLAVDPRNWNNVLLATEVRRPECADPCATYRSRDGGTSWSCLDAQLPGGSGGGFHFTAGGTAYVTSILGTARSTDGGGGWELRSSAEASLQAVSGEEVLWAAWVEGLGPFVGIYRSTDGGASWERRPATGLPSTSGPLMIAADPTNPLRLFATSGRGVYASTDGGETFADVTADLFADHPNVFLTHLTLGPGPAGPATQLYAGTVSGLFARAVP